MSSECFSYDQWALVSVKELVRSQVDLACRWIAGVEIPVAYVPLSPEEGQSEVHQFSIRQEFKFGNP